LTKDLCGLLLDFTTLGDKIGFSLCLGFDCSNGGSFCVLCELLSSLFLSSLALLTIFFIGLLALLFGQGSFFYKRKNKW